MDTVNEIAVANNGNLLSVYPRTGNGNIAPLRTISGSNTGFNNGPIGIALDAVNDEFVVSNPQFLVVTTTVTDILFADGFE